MWQADLWPVRRYSDAIRKFPPSLTETVFLLELLVEVLPTVNHPMRKARKLQHRLASRYPPAVVTLSMQLHEVMQADGGGGESGEGGSGSNSSDGNSSATSAPAATLKGRGRVPRVAPLQTSRQPLPHWSSGSEA